MYTKISEIISSECHKKVFLRGLPFLENSSKDLMTVNCLSWTSKLRCDRSYDRDKCDHCTTKCDEWHHISMAGDKSEKPYDRWTFQALGAPPRLCLPQSTCMLGSHTWKDLKIIKIKKLQWNQLRERDCWHQTSRDGFANRKREAFVRLYKRSQRKLRSSH